jgi:hypothetical protein
MPTTPPEDEGIGPLAQGGYPVQAPPTDAGPTRERWIWTGVVVAVAAITGGLLVFGGFGGMRPELQQIGVAEVLTSPVGPAARFGSHEIKISGWYAELSNGCAGDSGGADTTTGWLQATCPVRVLLPAQPAATATQAELVRDGLRLAAPNGQPFPPPAAPGSGTAGLEQLIFDGHFDDPTAAGCVPDRRALCRNTFVVSGYIGLIK